MLLRSHVQISSWFSHAMNLKILKLSSAVQLYRVCSCSHDVVNVCVCVCVCVLDVCTCLAGQRGPIASKNSIIQKLM